MEVLTLGNVVSILSALFMGIIGYFVKREFKKNDEFMKDFKAFSIQFIEVSINIKNALTRIEDVEESTIEVDAMKRDVENLVKSDEHTDKLKNDFIIHKRDMKTMWNKIDDCKTCRESVTKKFEIIYSRLDYVLQKANVMKSKLEKFAPDEITFNEESTWSFRNERN